MLRSVRFRPGSGMHRAIYTDRRSCKPSPPLLGLSNTSDQLQYSGEAMPQIANPMDALITLQPAIDSGGVSLQQCTLHSDLWMLVDFPGGEPRTTYAVVEDGLV